MTATIEVRQSHWGLWLLESIQQPKLDQYDIAEFNLRSAVELPHMQRELIGLGIDKINDWTDRVEDFTRNTFKKFRGKRGRFTEAQIRVGAMLECLQRVMGIQYNLAFMEGGYNAIDSRNLFIHGPLTGFGGTCASLPVVYCAIGRRLRYPIFIAECKDHFFCRWEGDETFCFEAAGHGFEARTEDFYRNWPAPMTAKQEEHCGYLRSRTEREEIAIFAGNRGNCLIDNLKFRPAIEAYALARQFFPTSWVFEDSYRLAFFTAQLWDAMQEVRQLHKSFPLQAIVDLAASEIHGPDADFFRPKAVKNMIRIINNYEHRNHDIAIQNRMAQA